MMTFEYIRIEI